MRTILDTTPKNQETQYEGYLQMKDEFYLKVAHALSGCQLVEQELKLYITEALELVRECVGNKMPFKMKGEDYAKDSLGRLIDVFEKLSDNKGLVSDLRSFTEERNVLSHQAITDCLDLEGGLLYQRSQEFKPRLDKIQSDAHRLVNALEEEGNAFRVHLWFEEISEDA